MTEQGECPGNCKDKIQEMTEQFLKQLNINTRKKEPPVPAPDKFISSKGATLYDDDQEDIYTSSVNVTHPMDSVLDVENCKDRTPVQDDDVFSSDNETTVKETYTIDGKLTKRTRTRTLSGSNTVACQSDCGGNCLARKAQLSVPFFQRQNSASSYLDQDSKSVEYHCCCEIKKMVVSRECQTDDNVTVTEGCQTSEYVETSIQNGTKSSESDIGCDNNGSNNRNGDESDLSRQYLIASTDNMERDRNASNMGYDDNLLPSLGAICDGDGQPRNIAMSQQMSSTTSPNVNIEFKGARPKLPKNLSEISQLDNLKNVPKKDESERNYSLEGASQTKLSGPMSLNPNVPITAFLNENRTISLPERSDSFAVNDDDENRYKSMPLFPLQSMGYLRPSSPMSPKFPAGISHSVFKQREVKPQGQAKEQNDFAKNLSLSEGSYPKKPFSFNAKLLSGTQNRVGRRSPNRHPSVKPSALNKENKLPGTTSLSADNTSSKNKISSLILTLIRHLTYLFVHHKEYLKIY